MFNVLGQIPISRQTLFPSCLPFPNFLNQMMRFLQICLGRLDRNIFQIFVDIFLYNVIIDMLLKKHVQNKYHESSILTQDIHNLQ
jgi:hypothetical protein